MDNFARNLYFYMYEEKIKCIGLIPIQTQHLGEVNATFVIP